MTHLDPRAAEIIRELRKREKRRKLELYRPYGHPDTLFGPQNPKVPQWSNKPWQLEFHEAGATHPERMQMAANRVGKTEEAAAEAAFHATGLYPDWWTGRRFDKGTLGWTGSPTNELSRDIIQKALLGGLGDLWGTGFLPVSRGGSPGLIGKAKLKQAGVADVVDFVKVRHTSGDVTMIQFKSYDQGWRKFQGTEPDWVWLDEEPDESDPQKRIYSEVQTRILTSGGIIMVTFTPLLGDTQLVRHFKTEAPPGTWLGMATWDDAPHLDEAEKERLKAGYPPHELKTRTQGVPMMGEGGVFPLSEEDIKCPSFEIPDHYARIKGIDFGIGHPQATVGIAWDRAKDIIYVYHVYRAAGKDTIHHSAQINSYDPWAPVAWPHDGLKRDNAGNVLHEQYRKHGVRTMLNISARYHNETGGSQDVEAIVMEVWERMTTGRLKVFSDCECFEPEIFAENMEYFFEEFRSYHRKEGRIVDKNDDVLKALFYAVMMRRFARPNIQRIRRPANSRPMVSVGVG